MFRRSEKSRLSLKLECVLVLLDVEVVVLLDDLERDLLPIFVLPAIASHLLALARLVALAVQRVR